MLQSTSYAHLFDFVTTIQISLEDLSIIIIIIIITIIILIRKDKAKIAKHRTTRGTVVRAIVFKLQTCECLLLFDSTLVDSYETDILKAYMTLQKTLKFERWYRYSLKMRKHQKT